MNNVDWYNNLLKGVVNNNEYVGIGFEVGAGDMKVHNNGDVSMANRGVCVCRYGGRFDSRYRWQLRWALSVTLAAF
jgi:hypothetical protein